jgi:hypothetical protein
MTRNIDIFVKINESTKSKVLLVDDKPIKVREKGSIATKTKQARVKHINDVLYVLGLAHNLLSVGYPIEKGYLVVFKSNEYNIYDKENHNHIIVKINILRDRVSSLNLHCEENRALKVGNDDDSWLGNICYEHINIRGLKLLQNKKMVKIYPLIDCVDQVYECCILGK